MKQWLAAVLRQLKLKVLRWNNYKLLSLAISIKSWTEKYISLKPMRACLLTLQMWNLRTDFTKVSIGDYFSALCGNYKALRVLPFFPTGALANQQACNLLAGAIGNKKREEKRDWLIEDINKINDRIEKISILITCFCLQFHLKENMHEYAKSQGLLTEGSFDIQKASSKIGQLEVKRKLLLFELRV